MSHRLLALLALPLLWAAVLLVWTPAFAAPLAASTAWSERTVSTEIPAAAHERGLAACCDGGLGGVADLSSEEPEPPQAAAPAPGAPAECSGWLAAASTPWPSRAPDQPLRPPTALPPV